MAAVRTISNAVYQSLAANDDGSTAQVPMGLTLNFFGTSYTKTWVNNNGNCSFASANGVYTPYTLTAALANPIISPLLCDVDTRAQGSPLVQYGTGVMAAGANTGRPVFIVNWLAVGYYAEKMDKRNSFQLLLIDRSDIAPGDCDLEFNYGDGTYGVGWETGEASGGRGGLGGVSAAAGYSGGSGQYGTFLEFPGSRIPGSFLNNSFQTGLIHNTGSPDGIKGRYLFPIRGGIPAPPPLPPPAPGPVNLIPPTFPTGDLSGLALPDGTTISVYTGRSAVSSLAGGADGYYEIDQLPIGLYSVLYSQCGYVPVLQCVTLSPNVKTTAPPVQLTAHDPADGFGYICGWAVDQVSGTPLAGAQVSVKLAGSANNFPLVNASTDAGGGFVLKVPVGAYIVSVQANGLPIFSWGLPVAVENSCPAVIGPIGVSGPPTGDGAIVGYVEDAVTYAALGGAGVMAGARDTSAAADGGYGFRFLPTPGQVTVLASNLGYYPRYAQVYLNQGETARVDLGLVPLTTPIGEIDGFVTDALTGIAISGAAVRVPGLTQAITTTTGYFNLDTVPAGQAAAQVIADGYEPQQESVTVAEGVTTRQSFALNAWTGTNACLYGQVRDVVTAAPVVGASVAVDAAAATSQAGGAYMVIFPVPPKTHTVKAGSAGYYPFEQDAVPVDYSESVQLDIGLVSTSTPVGAIHGLVLDARHTDIRLGGALISVGKFLQAIASFPQGEYLLPYVPSGVLYTGTASIDGYVPLTVAGIEAARGQVLEMDWPLTSLSDEFQATGTLTATVLEAGSGNLLAGASVTTGAFGAAGGVTDSTGKTTLMGLLPGNYTVSATLPGYRVGRAMAVVLPGANTCTVTLRGFPNGYQGGEVYGYVSAAILPPGVGIGGCLVSANPRTDPAFLSGWTGPDVVTDANGFYVLDNVPAPATSLTFDKADYDAIAIGAVPVQERQATRRDAELSPFDGRVPAGWTVFFGEAVACDRPLAAAVAAMLPPRPALSLAWGVSASGPPAQYTVHLGPAAGQERPVLVVPGSRTAALIPGVPPGSYVAFVTADGSGPSNETSAVVAPEPELSTQAEALLCQADTAALPRYRRLRWGVRTPTVNAAPLLRLAVLLPPGVRVGQPAVMGLDAPAATVKGA